MQNVYLKIAKAEMTADGILIREVEVIEARTGATLKVAKQTPELLQMFKSVEIDASNYIHFEQLKKKNPNLLLLANRFNLCTT